MKTSPLSFAPWVGAIALFLPLAVHAGPVLVGVSNAQYNIQAGTLFSGTAGSVSDRGGVATGSAFGPLVEAVGVTFASVPDDSRNGTSSAVIKYFFGATGGTPGTIVPILISGAWDATAFGTGVAAVQVTTGLDLTHGLFTRDLSFVCHEADACTGASFTIHEQVIAGDEWTILISAAGVAGTSGKYRAFVDPIITIDPSFAQASDYSLIFSADVSPGVGGPVSVPEPGTLALLVGGGLATLIARRRRGRTNG